MTPRPEPAARQTLADCRVRIDALDLQILSLVNERARLVERIGAAKRELAMPIYEPRREDQVFANVLSGNAGPLSPEAVRRIFERVIDEMRTLQRQRMEAGAEENEC